MIINNGKSAPARCRGGPPEDAAHGSETLVSSTVKDLVIGSGLDFDEGRRMELKGIPNEWTLHAVRQGELQATA